MISEKTNMGLNGTPQIPGDKSISHRSIIIPSISEGICEVTNILKSDDVMHTLKAFSLMGVKIEEKDQKIIIYGKGLKSLKKPSTYIYLGNSGTSARLLTGLLASQNFETEIKGDDSLSSRPMNRMSEPLKKMDANITTTNGCLPIKIHGKELKCTNIEVKIPSAQIKSGIILAALNTIGVTKITENFITRDHTEIMLESFGAGIEIKKEGKKKIIAIEGGRELKSKNIEVPCDLSSSSFFIVAALINENSNIKLNNININPTRDGILIALEKMGADITIYNKRKKNNEMICDIEVRSSILKGCELNEDIAKLMIDEYPILSIAAAFAKSPSIFRGLGELRVKESDRLSLIKNNLINCGVECKVEKDDLYIFPKKNFKINNKIIRTDFDHRIAMAFAVMGSKIGPLEIKDSESINTSFPSFIKQFNNIGGNIF